MCTVTYIPINNGFVLTSSRDEKTHRQTLKPQFYAGDLKVKLVYPKDEVSGGTWIAMDTENKYACLLNGGFTNHIKKENYSKSRGNVLLDFFKYNTISEFVQKVDLNDVEPFTLLLIQNINAFEFKQFVWDGFEKYVSDVDTNRLTIWSSATLYSEEDRALRTKWFEDWILKYRSFDDVEIMKFHSGKHSDHSDKNILMKRADALETVSISQIRSKNKKTIFEYVDLKDNTTTHIQL
jgi:hypothetical protein